MATETKSNVVKVKPSSANRDGSSSKPKFDSNLVKNKAVVGSSSSNRQSVDSRHKVSTTTTTTTTNVSRTAVKGKSVSSTSKTTTKTTAVKQREKKVYSLPGQKFDVPEERDSLRIFYESLSKQIPSSEMAEFWMMEHGLLSPERAKKAFEKKQRKQKEIRMGTPIKSPPPPPSRAESSKRPQQLSPPPQSRGESSKKPQQVTKNGEAKAKRRIVDDSSDDDDFVLSHKRRKV